VKDFSGGHPLQSRMQFVAYCSYYKRNSHFNW